MAAKAFRKEHPGLVAGLRAFRVAQVRALAGGHPLTTRASACLDPILEWDTLRALLEAVHPLVAGMARPALLARPHDLSARGTNTLKSCWAPP